MAGRWARLAAVFFLVGLATSRLSLVLHELVGHGGTAVLLGGDLVEHRLFLFGGGWVSFAWGDERGLAAALTVSLAGIALEIAAAAVALFVAGRVRTPIARVGLVGLAAADLLHAGFYLAAGTHHGFGDGRVLHAALGPARAALVWPVSVALVFAGLLLARRMAHLAGAWIGARSRPGRAGALALAVAAAGLGHGALTYAERRMTTDETYGRIMKREGERRVDREVARLAEAARHSGKPIDPATLDALRSELEKRNRDFPLIPVLATALAAACLLGVWLGVREARTEPDDNAPTWKAVAPLAAVTGASLLLVAIIRLFE